MARTVSEAGAKPAHVRVHAERRTSAAINVQHTGVVLGLVLGGWHAGWAALVAAGWAQPVVDFIFWLHFIKPIYVVEPFNGLRAVALILVTALVGYVVGSAFAWLWNRMQRS